MTTMNAPPRTAHDYAIEHAEYMACAAERLDAAMNALHEAEERLLDLTEVVATNKQYEENEALVEQARESVGELRAAVRNSIYEFRKRRDRVLAQPAEPVKVPSDDDIIDAVKVYGMARANGITTASELELRLHDIRALLARYGNAAQPVSMLTAEDVERQYENGIHVGSGLRRESCPCGFCRRHRYGFNKGTAQPSVPEPCTDTRHHERYIAGWNACRSAMLAPTPPATGQSFRNFDAFESHYMPKAHAERKRDEADKLKKITDMIGAPAAGQPHQSTPEEDAEAEWLMKRQEAR